MWNIHLPALSRLHRPHLSLTQLQALYAVMFFFSLHSFLPQYANSSFLVEVVGQELVGLIFSLGAVITLVALLELPRILTRFGIFATTLVMVVLETTTLLVLSYASSPPVVLAAFILHLPFIILLLYAVDIFVSALATPRRIGRVRGTLLTMLNVAIVISPFLLAFIVGAEENYKQMFVVSAAFLIPAVLLLFANFRTFKDPEYEQPHVRKTLARAFADKNIFNVLVTNLFLRFFFSWMVIYVPIYLIQTIGFQWDVLGPMFAIALIPFIVSEYPIGRIADLYIGEKEMLIAGFIITAIASALLSVPTVPSIVLWTTLLFVTRIGASMIEITSESYFFKHVSAHDTSLIAVYRMLTPFSIVIAPLVSTALIAVIDVRYSFIALGAIMATGIIFAMRLVDTK